MTSRHKIIKKYNDLITYLTKKFQIDLNYIINGGSLLSIVGVTSAISGFLMTLVFANYLTPEVFGVYKYVLATYTLIAIATLPGIDSSMIETIAKGNEGAFLHGMKTKFKWGFLGTLISICYSFYNFYNGEVVLGNVFLLVAVFIPFMETFSLYNAYLNAQKKYLFWSLSEIISQIVVTSSLFLAVYFTNDVVTVITVYFLTYIFYRAIITFIIFYKYKINSKIDMKYLTYGNQMSIFSLFSRGISTIDQMILFNVVGPLALATFSIANAIPSRALSFTRISGSLAYPKFADKDEITIAKTLPKKMFYFGLLIFLACLVYVALAPIFFKLFFPKYIDAVKYTQALIFLIVSGATYPFGSFLLMQKRIKDQFSVAIVNIIVKVLCLVIFVPLIGIWGAIISVLASSFSNIFMAYYILFKIRKGIKS